MGLSFHDESSMAASIGNLSLPFIPDISNPILENEIVDEERGHDDFEDQLSDDSDTQMVDRWIVERKDSSITKVIDNPIILSAAQRVHVNTDEIYNKIVKISQIEYMLSQVENLTNRKVTLFWLKMLDGLTYYYFALWIFHLQYGHDKVNHMRLRNWWRNRLCVINVDQPLDGVRTVGPRYDAGRRWRYYVFPTSFKHSRQRYDARSVYSVYKARFYQMDRPASDYSLIWLLGPISLVFSSVP